MNKRDLWIALKRDEWKGLTSYVPSDIRQALDDGVAFRAGFPRRLYDADVVDEMIHRLLVKQ